MGNKHFTGPRHCEEAKGRRSNLYKFLRLLQSLRSFAMTNVVQLAKYYMRNTKYEVIMKTIGIIGCGAIGSAIAGYASKELAQNIEKIILCDVDAEKLKELASKINGSETSSDIDETIDKADLVIEAVSPKISPVVLKEAIDKGKDVMIMSIGGLLGNEGLLDKARAKGINVLLPSGAICGIDGVKASRIAGIESVSITTRKSPGAVKGAPYLSENNIDVDSIEEETVIFDGSAIDAIKGFPKNVNVSALLSLAGVGPDKTRVRIVISPEFKSNSHEIEVKSAAGSITARTDNVKSPDNPKTSYLAALAAMSALDSYFDSVRVGT